MHLSLEIPTMDPHSHADPPSINTLLASYFRVGSEGNAT